MHFFLTPASPRKPRLLLALTLSILFLITLVPAVSFAQADPPPPENAKPRAATTLEDTTVAIDTGIQADPRYQIVVVVPGPVHGTITQGGAFPNNFIINYTPGANQTAPVSFSYQICTIIGTPTLCGLSALVTVSITPVNDPPQAVPDGATVVYGQSVLIPVLSNDNGGANENDTVSLVSVGSPGAGNGSTVVEGNQVRYTAPALLNPCNPIPQVTFTYQAQDSSGNQATGTVTVTVKCPGTPSLEMGAPYGFVGHTFKIDVILKSADVNVAAVDFFLNYNNSCMTDPDMPTNTKLGDDVTTTLPTSNFLFDAQDAPFPGTLHIIAASTTGPASILAGPGAGASRTIATIQFKATAPLCTPPSSNLTFGVFGFTGTNGTAIDGIVVSPASIMLDPTKLNSSPTSLTLSNNKVNENSPSNTFIGKFSTTDPNVGDTHTYAPAAPYFLSPDPLTSIQRFRIRPQLFNNDELAVNVSGLPSGVYSITVSSTDNYNGVITKTFTIEVLDVNAAPIANDDGNPNINPFVTIIAAGAKDILVLANDTDSNDFPTDPACTNCSVVSATNGSKGIVINQGTSVRYIPTNATYTGIDTFNYVITDNDAPNALTAQAKVTVTVAAETIDGTPAPIGTVVQPGDCNKSGTIEAGDLTATGLEIFDGDGNLWYDIYKGSYKNFSPRGCNSNQDNIVDAGDIACTAARIFKPSVTCGTGLTASSAATASLTVSGNLVTVPGSIVDVPIMLTAAGNSVAAAAFAVNFDSSVLTFDATDADANGIPDAVTFNVPDGLMTAATYNVEESRVEIIITGLIPPFPLLGDGAIATVSLTTNSDADDSATAVTITNGSLGSDEGASIPVEINDGSVEITAQALQNSLYLPFISAQ